MKALHYEQVLKGKARNLLLSYPVCWSDWGPGVQVTDLKQQIATVVGVPADKLKLVHKGKAIHNDSTVSLSDQGLAIKSYCICQVGLCHLPIA